MKNSESPSSKNLVHKSRTCFKAYSIFIVSIRELMYLLGIKKRCLLGVRRVVHNLAKGVLSSDVQVLILSVQNQG